MTFELESVDEWFHVRVELIVALELSIKSCYEFTMISKTDQQMNESNLNGKNWWNHKILVVIWSHIGYKANEIDDEQLRAMKLLLLALLTIWEEKDK